MVDENYTPGYAAVSIPYEFHPYPVKGTKGIAFDRGGAALGEVEVINVKSNQAMDETAILTMKVPAEWSMKARFFKPAEEGCL